MLLHFLGHFPLGHRSHRVQSVQVIQARIIIACKQYNLKEEWLAQVPDFAIKSEAM